MSKRYSIEIIRDFIEKKGHELLDKEYSSANKYLTIKCKCGIIYSRRIRDFNRGMYHCNGKNNRAQKVKVEPRNCLHCQKEFKPHSNMGKYCSISCSGISINSKRERKINIPKKECLFCRQNYQPLRNSSILCSLKCRKMYQQTQEYKNRAKKWGVKAGLASVIAQQRRSKNEIYFTQLCEEYFGKEKIKTNLPIFDGWDADIIIPSLNIAIGWNGVWHYREISKTQSLLQVQTRDNIKHKIIEKYGYKYYIIADMGKYNPKFVKQEFEIFLLMNIDY